ncbi:MAG: GIY-YIG nuclease family protein [Candidatus Omnitrophica bacterium]|nr:GIY-YIG nuclease family protein [Candidatus Omnitrophota bacterium]
MNPALPKIGWQYIYLLSSKVKDWIYIGSTNNLKRRLIEHKEGRIYSTRRMLPVELIYFEGYRSKDTAFAREKSLKRFGSGLAKLKLRLGITKKGRAG